MAAPKYPEIIVPACLQHSFIPGNSRCNFGGCSVYVGPGNFRCENHMLLKCFKHGCGRI